MAPRILDVGHCPHCKSVLERPTPRMCPTCGASLQQRHLALGCLSTGPLLLALLGAAWSACAAVGGTEPAQRPPEERTGAADRAVAFPDRRP